MLLLASITILSGAFPEAYAIYDSSKVYANLFTFLVANAASGKGRTTSCLKLVSLIEQEVREANKQEMDDYQQELADIRAIGRKASGMPLPKEPPLSLADNSCQLLFYSHLSGAARQPRPGHHLRDRGRFTCQHAEERLRQLLGWSAKGFPSRGYHLSTKKGE